MGSRPTAAGSRAGGREGRSRPPSPGAQHIEKCRFTDLLFLFFLPGSSSPRLCVAGQLPQPGRGKASLAHGAPGSRYGPVQACVRPCVAPSRPACGSAWPRADLRAGLRAASQSRVRTCVRLCASRVRLCAADPAAPTPLRPLRISSLADGELGEGNEISGPHPGSQASTGPPLLNPRPLSAGIAQLSAAGDRASAHAVGPVVLASSPPDGRSGGGSYGCRRGPAASLSRADRPRVT